MEKSVLLFVKNLQGRGVSKIYLSIAKFLQDNGFLVDFVIRENVIDFDTSFLKNLHIIEENITQNVDELIKKHNIKMVISNNVKYIEPLKNIDNDRIFYTVHMLWSTRIFKNLRFKKLLELKREYKNKNIIVGSNAVKNDLLNKIKIKPKSIRVIFDALDFKKIKEMADEPVDIKNDYIINVGAFSKEKNHKLLLEVYKKLDTNLDLLLIGEGKLKADIIKLAKKLNIEDRVKFLGWVDNPYPYIKNAKLMILSSTNEGLPGVAIESLILKTPLVSYDSIGIREVLTDKLSYYIAKDKESLIKKAQEALEHYPEIKDEYIARLNREEALKEYLKLYESINR